MNTKNNKQSLVSIIFFNIVPIISNIIISLCILFSSITHKLSHSNITKLLCIVTISAVINVVIGIVYLIKSKNKKSLGFTGIVNVISLFMSLAVVIPVVGIFLIALIFFGLLIVLGKGV